MADGKFETLVSRSTIWNLELGIWSLEFLSFLRFHNQIAHLLVIKDVFGYVAQD